MKFILILMAAVAMVVSASAADNKAKNLIDDGVAKKVQIDKEKPWFSNIEVGGVGAYRQASFISGHAERGAGVVLGIPANKHVTIEGRLLAFEESPNGDEGNRWKGDIIDEIAISGRSVLFSTQKKTLTIDGYGGGDRSQQLDDWGFHVGLGLRWNPAKQFSLTLSREIRSWFRSKHDHVTILSASYLL